MPGRLRAPLRHSAFRTLWLGQSLALAAAEIHLVALAWLALRMTGSALALGTVLAAGLAPRILLTLAGGVAADRFPVRRVLVVGNLARAVTVGVFVLVILTARTQLWHLHAVAVFLGAVTSFYQPALYAAVPRLVGGETLRPANALMRGTAELIGTLGPVAAGTLVAAVDVRAAFGATGVCYLLAALTLRGTGRASAEAVPPRTPGSGAAGTLREGIALVRGDAALLRVLLMTAVAGLVLTGPLTVGVPWLAAERYGAGPATFGVMLSMWTAGSLGGVVLAGALSRMPSINRLLLVVAAVIGTALVALGLAPGMIVAGAALLLMGVGAGCFNVLVMTWLQERTDQAVLGRLMSFVELAEVATTPVSYLLAGALLGVSVSGLYVAAALVFVLSAAAMLTPRADRLLSVGGRP